MVIYSPGELNEIQITLFNICKTHALPIDFIVKFNVQLNRQLSKFFNFFFGKAYLFDKSLTKTLNHFVKISVAPSQTAYNYAFDVHLVDSCPVNESDWEAAAVRIGCNSTRGYHCVPDIFHSTLIEFCYNKTRIRVSKGTAITASFSYILGSF